MTNRLYKRRCSVPDCMRPHNARGYCFGHYERWKKLGHPDAARPLNTHVDPNASLRERINRRIEPDLTEDECWPWQGSFGGVKTRTGLGYGKLTVSGKQLDAHRVSWELHHGRAVPVGSQVMHTCDFPPCVNPKHLRLGSNDENVEDMVAKLRHTYGERNPQAKLTENDVLVIRSSPATASELAQQFGVTRGTINGVLAGRSWRHVK